MEQEYRDRRQTGLLLAVFGIWWAGFIHTFFYEWWVNEQYSFGLLVPFLTGYLVYLRWGDRPSPRPPRHRVLFWIVPLGAVLLLTPLRIVLEANPEWRAALWLYALLCLASTVSLVGAVGGWPWIRHFFIPLSLILFAVPWPMPVEQPVVQNLMRGVSAVTVETLNLIGFFAQREGNLIRLDSGLIGVEEACSGVRSLQSTLMAAYFLGELFRWQWRYRLALIIAGCSVSLLLNLGRTLTLTLVAIQRGSEAMEVIHDPVGHVVSLGSFIILFFFTWILHRRFRKTSTRGDRQEAPGPGTAAAVLPIGSSVVLVVVFLLQFPVAHFWYERGQPRDGDRVLVDVDWESAGSRVEEKPISPAVRAVLRYSEGEQVDFRRQNELWSGFLFRWEAGRISSHVTVHRPEVCLPAAGFKLIATGDTLEWTTDGLDLQFSSSVYRVHTHDYYVFYAMWDTVRSRPVPTTRSWADRLSNAWHGLRINERQSLEVVLVGPASLEHATQRMRQFLDEALQSTRS